MVLLDLQLPGMDGLEVARRLKAAPETGGILIMAITAFAMQGDRDKAYQSGCDAYVPKPIDTRALPGLVADLLASRSPTGA